ncbi:MAG: peptidoglycan DD-metalloendopeptidase family protein [Rhodospirillaceae bacterium]|nr:peptidoglycan DD-metalloendopeptidase family protein [Rhodospirillaceae bacterium]
MTLQQNSPSWRKATTSRIKCWFPERQIHLRTDGRIAFFRITTFAQVLLLAMVVGTSGWFSFATYSFVQHEKVIAAKDGRIATARLAYESLLGEVAEYQNKFNSITIDLEHDQALMLGLVERNASLQKNLRTVSKELESTEDDRQLIASARESLRGKLVDLENQMRSMTGRNYVLKDNLNSIESDLQIALSERNQALFDGSRMRRYVKDLEGRLTGLQTSHETSVQRLTARTVSHISTLEKVITTVGLDANKVAITDAGRPKGQGGPFIPADSSDLIPAGKLKTSLQKLDVHLARLGDLQQVMERLPLAPPLDVYSITSRYGKRRDPLNKRWSAHYGVDFGGVLKTKVRAPAPGRVTYAGWKGKYGRYVEIDHGAGVRTRYGHLHKIYVKRGQTVKFRDKIGLLGNSGRSTGAHLHYETVFNGKSINPMKFIKAGRHVFQDN